MVRRNTGILMLLVLAILMAVVLASCGWGHQRRAPVVDWAKTKTKAASPAASAAEPSAPASAVTEAAAETSPVEIPAKRAPIGVENAGKPGYYTVQKGDTLIRIGLDAGQNYRDIARWNGIENPNKIEIGDVYRVVPPEEPVVAKPVAIARLSASTLPPVPAAVPAPSKPPSALSPPAVTATPSVTPPVATVPAKPLAGAAAASPPETLASNPPPAKTGAATVPATPPNPVPNQPVVAEDSMEFIWPAKGEVIAGFDETKNRKGLDLSGGAGDPVLAAAEGKVVYAGEGLRGYGKLIIIKHNAMFLTAYAHNQTILVKEDQSVKKGQKIAEMGSTDSDRVKLHFEVRRLGRPVDPLKYLINR